VVTAGAEFAVKVAAFEVVDPPVLVNTARYWLPLCEAWAVKVSVVEVAPGTLFQLAPSVLTCHWTVGDGVPVAAAVNVTEPGAQTLWLDGEVVIAGAWPGGVMVVLTDFVTPFRAAWISAVAPDDCGYVVMVNGAVFELNGTVTLRGVEAAALFMLESATRTPPEGAGPERVTVPVKLLPPTAVLGETERSLKAIPEPTGVTVTGI
jgi:hypothetical protein